MFDVGSLDRSLAEVLDALLALPPDAHGDRYLLLKRRDELRSRAAQLRTDDLSGLSTAELMSAFRALGASLRHLASEDPLRPAPDPAKEAPGVARNRPDRAVLTDKLRRVEAQLVARGIDPHRQRHRATH